MKTLLLFFCFYGCAFVQPDQLGICYFHSDPKGEVGKNVKVVNSREILKNCKKLKDITTEECKGLGDDSISYENILKNQTGFLGGNVLFVESGQKPSTSGVAYTCTE